MQHRDEPFYDFLLRARRHLERVLTPACNPRRPTRYRTPGCNGNWTGITTDGVEYVGGCMLSEHVAMWKVSDINFGPVLFKGELIPRMVEDRDGKKLVTSDARWPMPRELSPDEYIEGRVRFELRLKAYRRAYLDLSREERTLADGFLAPGQNGFGSAPREYGEALRYIDEVRPVPFEEWCAGGVQTPCEP